jgi:WD40 repeat protein/DNA-binding SARP family transcriptional activator
MTVTHRLHLFGRVVLEQAAQPAWRFPTRKAMALLGYLARQSHSVPRSELTSLLWGDLPDTRSRRNLTRELSQLSAQLPSAFESDYHTIRWAPPASIWVDTTAMLALLVPAIAAPAHTPAQRNPARSDPWFDRPDAAAIDAARLAEAVALYGGDFMDGLYLDDCPDFETWLLREREYWRRLVLEQLDVLIAHHALHQRDAQAILFARRCLELEPWNEQAHRALMVLLARGGNRAAALAQYDACRRLLTAELGVNPAEETLALYEQIRAGQIGKQTRRPEEQEASRQVGVPRSLAPTPAASVPSRPGWVGAPKVQHFYGREAELAALRRWAVDERCRVISVLGMGGIGKTLLAAQLAHAVADQMEVVIWRSLLNAPPLDTLLRGIIAALSDETPADFPADLDHQLALLLDLIRRRRCLLILDNVESIFQPGARAGAYRDDCTAYEQLLRAVAEQAHQSCLLLTSREQPQGVRLQAEGALIQSLRLSGLDPSACREILHGHRLGELPERADALIERYSGNPLALTLVAETIHEIFAGDVRAFLRDDTLIFDDIRDMLDQQWERLTPLEQDVLLWLAVEREAMTPEQIQRDLVGDLGQPALLEALRSLVRRSLVQVEGAAFTLQNVLMEYVTARLIDQVCTEIACGAAGRFNTHALIKAQAKHYVRASQVRLILQPIAARLVAQLGRDQLERQMGRILRAQQAAGPRAPGYVGGNAINLLLHLSYDLRGYDFSQLSIWQAQLQAARLPDVSFAHADLAGSVFRDDFRSQDPLAWSADGLLIATAAGNGKIYLWCGADQQLAGICAGHSGYILALAFSPDSRFLASAGADETVRVWDVQEFQLVATLRGHERGVSAIVWSRDGSLLISGSWDRTIRLWDAHAAQSLQIVGEHADGIGCLAISDDGRLLASDGSDRIVRIWDLHRRQLISALPHPARVNTVAFSPDGALLASGCFNEALCIWDVSLGAALHTLAGSTNQVKCVAFSPDGALIASGGDARIRLWEAHTGRLRTVFDAQEPWVAAVAWNPDSTQLASLGGNSIQIWDISADQPLAIIQGHSDEVLSAAFSPDGLTFASSHADNIIRLWDVASWTVRHTLHGHTNSITNLLFSPDHTTLFSGSFDQTIRLWDVESGQLRRTLRGHTNLLFIVALSADGATLASGSKDETIWVWNVADGQVLHVLRGHRGEVASLAFSPDGATLASGGEDGTIRLWDARTGQALSTIQAHTAMVHWLVFDAAGGLLISASGDETVRFWDIQSGALVRTLRGHTAIVCELDISPDGTILASCGSADQTVRLWNLRTGQLLHTLRHANWVVSMAFSPDGATLVSGSEYGTLRIWDVQTGACLRVLRAPGPYAGMNITGATGITEAQRAALRALGAVER